MDCFFFLRYKLHETVEVLKHVKSKEMQQAIPFRTEKVKEEDDQLIDSKLNGKDLGEKQVKGRKSLAFFFH